MAFFLTKILKGLQIQKENTTNPSVIEIIPGGTDGKKTTIVGSQTTDVTITLPGSAGTLATTADVSSAQSTLDGQIDSLQTNLEGQISTVQDNLDAHATDITGAHAATAISSTPYGDLAATDVQAALNELQDDITILSSATILDPVTKTYVDNQDATKLNLSGGTLTGDLNLGANKLTNVNAISMGFGAASPLEIEIKSSAAPSTGQMTSITTNFIQTIDYSTNRSMGISPTQVVALDSNTNQVTYVTPSYISIANNSSGYQINIFSDNIEVFELDYASWGFNKIAVHPNRPEKLAVKSYVDSLYNKLAIKNSTTRTAPNTNRWQDIIYDNSLFVAVGDTAVTNRVMTSPDGITWTARVAAGDYVWYSLAYGGSPTARFVAVAGSGTNRVMHSTDGITWTGVSVTANEWRSVIWTGSQFVAVSATGTNRVMTSTDGLTWTTRPAQTATWLSLVRGRISGTYVLMAVSSDGTNNIMISYDDGNTWPTLISAPVGLYSVAYSIELDLFVATSSTSILYSANGTEWVTAYSTSPTVYTKVKYVNNLFIATSPSSGSVLISPDGKNWQLVTTNNTTGIFSVAHGNDWTVLVGTNRITTSLRF